MNEARSVLATHKMYASLTRLCWGDILDLLIGCRARAKSPLGRERLARMEQEAAFQTNWQEGN